MSQSPGKAASTTVFHTRAHEVQNAQQCTIVLDSASSERDSTARRNRPHEHENLGICLEPDAVVGRYRITKEIGCGGQGRVFLAVDEELGRRVAIKTILAKPVEGEDWLIRFQNEARALARLDHPNIVQVFEAFQQQGFPFFAMEYVEGRSLDDLLRSKSFPRREFIRLMATCCEAMACAHKHGLIHRDLKPQNILIAKDGQPKLTDFGLAKSLREDSAHCVATMDGEILGSPAYMAPEQAQGRRALVGPPTDVYSLGTILYEGLTGRLPFDPDSPMEVMFRIVHEDTEPAIALDPSVGRDLSAICMKALEKDPRERYATAGEMAADLRRYLRGEPVLARPIALAARFTKAIRRNRDLAVMSGMALTFMAVTLSLLIALFARQSSANIREGLRTELKSVAGTAAMMFTADEIEQVPESDAEKTDAYERLVKRLNEIRRRNLRIRNAYVLKKSGEAQGLVFVADADAFLPATAGGNKRLPGEAYTPAEGSAAAEAFAAAVADPKPVRTKWGEMLSGYAPILRDDGTTVAILGLDIGVEQIHMVMQPTLRTTAHVSGLAGFLFMGFTIFASVRVLRRRKRKR